MAEVPPDVALGQLMEGNQRWAAGQLEHPHQSVERRLEVARHQDPFAVVFSCIDSRVPPEIVFDRGVGDLFVIRTGAQALDEGVVFGSVEFGPNGYPSARLILVLGHSGCGAIKAARDSISSGTRAPGHIQAVVDALRPAYHRAAEEVPDVQSNAFLAAMVRWQVRLTVDRLRTDELLAQLIENAGLMIVGGLYDLTTGLVDLIA